jgi:hypothetical protein
MDDVPFATARIKLDRARQFISELEQEQEAYRRSDLVSVKISGFDIEMTWRKVGLRTGAIAGDAIHNIRTSLDQMASELARMAGRSDKDVYFPFAADAADLERAIKSKCFHKAGDDAVELLKQFAPYKGGNDALRAVHDLDIQDKHSTILVVDQNRKFQLNIDWGPSLRDNLDPIPTVRVDPESIFYVFPAGALEGRPVVETLKELVELGDGIIEAFTRMVALREPKP